MKGFAIRRVSAGVALGCALATLTFGSAHAAVEGFDGGDGDQAADCSAAVLDWQCLAPADVLVAGDAVGAGDDTFAGGSKEDDPSTWAYVTEAVQAKADVVGVWEHVRRGADGRTLLDIAFARAGSNGDTYLGIELSQSQQSWTNALGAVVPCRTDGDVLVSYEVHNPPVVRVFEWAGSGGPANCPDGATGTWTEGSSLLNGSEVAMNLGGPIENFFAPQAFGSVFGTARFGEASLDLRAVADAVDYPGTCEYFREVSVKSRSAASVSSTLQDWVKASDVIARSCETPGGDDGDGGGGDGGGGDGGGGGGGGGGDLTPPTTPTLTAANSCSGTVALSGTGEAGSIVSVYAGNKPVGAVAVAGDGKWALTLTGVADGTYAYSADAADDAGNLSGRSAATTVWVDATAPVISGFAAASPQPGTVVLTGTTDPGASVTLMQDGAPVGTVKAGQDGAFGLTLGSVAAGTHAYRATVSDACRSSQASASATVAGSSGGGSGTGDGSGDGTDGTGTPVTTPTDEVVTASPGVLTPGAPTGTGQAAEAMLTEVFLGAGAGEVKTCALKPFKAYVRLKGVRRVQFLVDGRRVRTVRRPDRLGQYVATIDPANLDPGLPHRLTARVTFRNKRRKARTLNLRFRRCDQCTSRRAFRIRVKNLRGGERPVRAVVYVNGRKAKVVKGKRLRSLVVLTGLPKGTYTVRIRTRTNKGRTVTDTRRYRTCVGKSAPR